MTPIPWPQIIRQLIERGLTQPQIAAACRCGQSTISDLLNGNTTDPRTSTGLMLLGLYRGQPLWPELDVIDPNNDERGITQLWSA